MRSHLRCLRVILVAGWAAASAVAVGQAAFVPFAPSGAGAVWPTQDEIHLALGQDSGRLFTAGRFLHDWRLSYFDTAANSFVTAATVSGRGPADRLLDLAADREEILLAWGCRRDERTVGKSLLRVSIATGQVLGERNDLPFIQFDYHRSTRTLFGIASPALHCTGPEDPVAYQQPYILMVYRVDTGVVSQVTAPQRTDGAIVRDLIINANGTEMYILWAPTKSASLPDLVAQQGFVEVYTLPALTRRGTVHVGAGEFRKGALAVGRNLNRLYVCPKSSAVSMAVIDLVTLQVIGAIEEADFQSPEFHFGGIVVADPQSDALYIANNPAGPPYQAIAVWRPSMANGGFLHGGQGPGALLFDPLQRRLFGAHLLSQNLAVAYPDNLFTAALVDYSVTADGAVFHPQGVDVLSTGGALLRIGGQPFHLLERIPVGTRFAAAGTPHVGLVARPPWASLYIGTHPNDPVKAWSTFDGEPVGQLPVTASALAVDNRRGLIYAFPAGAADTVNVVSATSLTVERSFPATGLRTFDALEVHETSGVLYGLRTQSLWRIHPTTGIQEPIALPTGQVNRVAAFGIDQQSATLLVAGYSNGLYALAAVQVVNQQLVREVPLPGMVEIKSLAVDPGQQLVYLYGLAETQGVRATALWAVDLLDGAIRVHPGPLPEDTGRARMVFSPERNQFAIITQMPSGLFLYPNFVPPGRRTAPKVPDPPKVGAIPENGRIRLAWVPQGETPVEGYVLERADHGGTFHTVLPAPLPGSITAFEDGDVTNGQTYRYRVWALGTAGVAGEPSEIVEAVPERTSLRFVLFPLDAAIRMRPGERREVSLLISGGHVRHVTLWADVLGTDLDVVFPSRTAAVPGVAGAEIVAASVASGGRRWVRFLATAPHDLASEALLAVDVVPVVNSTEPLQHASTPRRASRLYLASDAALTESSGEFVVVKGSLGLPDNALTATAIDYTVSYPDGRVMIVADSVATGGRFSRAFRVPPPGPRPWTVQATWQGSSTRPGGTSNILPLPFRSTMARAHAAAPGNGEPVALLIGGVPPAGKAAAVGSTLSALRSALFRQRFAAERTFLLADASLPVPGTTPSEPTAQDVRELVQANGSASLLLVYLIGKQAGPAGAPCVELSDGSRVCAEDALAWVPNDQPAIVVVDAPYSGAFVQAFSRQQRGQAAVLAGCQAGQRADNLPDFSAIFSSLLHWPLHEAYLFTYDAITMDFSTPSPNEPAEWNVLARESPHRNRVLGSAFVPPAQPIPDTLPPELQQVAAFRVAEVSREVPIWIEAVDLPDPSQPLSAQVTWRDAAGVAQSAALPHLGGARYETRIVPMLPGRVDATIVARDGAGNESAVALAFDVAGTQDYYDRNRDGKVNGGDILLNFPAPARQDWYYWLDFARWWQRSGSS